MKTYADSKGVVHVLTRQYPDWTCCNQRINGVVEQNSSKFPTCLWCVISRLWKPW
jgi:hypothetical protein